MQILTSLLSKWNSIVLSSIEKITAIDDILINENIVKSTGFLQQLHAQIKRNLFPLYRNKLFLCRKKKEAFSLSFLSLCDTWRSQNRYQE